MPNQQISQKVPLTAEEISQQETVLGWIGSKMYHVFPGTLHFETCSKGQVVAMDVVPLEGDKTTTTSRINNIHFCNATNNKDVQFYFLFKAWQAKERVKTR